MNYIRIDKDNLLNGEGVRVVLWTTGCEHHCFNCHNKETWCETNGVEFTNETKEELYKELSKEYIAGLTLSGGDPLAPHKREEIGKLVKETKEKFPNKDIWCWTGYKWEEIQDLPFLKYIDVLIDGEFVQALYSPNLKWKGSSNQRVIDVQKSLQENKVILYCE